MEPYFRPVIYLSTVRGAHGHVSFLAHFRSVIYTKSLRFRLIVQQVQFDAALVLL